MAYGTYDRVKHDRTTGDVALATLTAINLNAVAGGLLHSERVVEPFVVDRFGYHPMAAFVYGTAPTKGYLGLYKYPFGMACYDLPTALWATNNLTEVMNAHAADITMHKAADSVNFPLPVVPVIDLAGMMVQVNLMQIAFKAHNTDTIAGSPTYHVAQDTTHAPANDTAVTTLATTITKLLDLLAKYNLHELELTAHTINNLHPAGKILLATIALVDGAAVGWNYFCDVDNLAVKAIPPYQGLGFQGIADFNAGDVVAIETKVMANGGTESGNFQPYFCTHPRAEATQNMPMAVDLTPVKTAVVNDEADAYSGAVV